MRDGGRAALVGSGQYVEGVRLWSRLRLRVVIVEGGSLTPQHGGIVRRGRSGRGWVNKSPYGDMSAVVVLVVWLSRDHH